MSGGRAATIATAVSQPFFKENSISLSCHFTITNCNSNIKLPIRWAN